MLFDDKYRTIKEPSEGIYRDKGSKFIAYVYPVRTESEVKAHLSNLKAAHPKARHYCWAIRLGPDRSIFKINDDGEPSGTAGRPILNTLLSNDLTNILVVVVRYFGGTLLGVPGLINAYKSATQEALTSATIIELTVNDYYLFSFEYPLMNSVMQIIKDYKLQVVSQIIELNCKIEVEIPKSVLNEVLLKAEKLSGMKTSYLRTC